jgi:predicted GNAT family acetyltransferase
MAAEEIIHQAWRQRFVLANDGEQAQLDYQLAGSTINFTNTFVPPELRGQGLAEKLVRHGLAWAKEQNFTIHASCWYVKKFLG